MTKLSDVMELPTTTPLTELWARVLVPLTAEEQVGDWRDDQRIAAAVARPIGRWSAMRGWDTHVRARDPRSPASARLEVLIWVLLPTAELTTAAAELAARTGFTWFTEDPATPAPAAGPLAVADAPLPDLAAEMALALARFRRWGRAAGWPVDGTAPPSSDSHG